MKSDDSPVGPRTLVPSKNAKRRRSFGSSSPILQAARFDTATNFGLTKSEDLAKKVVCSPLDQLLP